MHASILVHKDHQNHKPGVAEALNTVKNSTMWRCTASAKKFQDTLILEALLPRQRQNLLRSSKVQVESSLYFLVIVLE